MAISAAALGQRMFWDENINKHLPTGYTISFQEAITVVSRNVIARAVTPSWAEGWFESTRLMSAGYKQFGHYLRDIADSYRRRGKLDQDLMGTETLALAPTDNLFKIMMTASEGEPTEQDKILRDEEVTGNAFLFLMAGHETTAHAISFSLGLLAFYPEIQQEVFEQVKKVLGSRERLDYSDITNLKLVTGAFYEALRMYPLAPRIARIATEDSVLSISTSSQENSGYGRKNIFVPVGSRVVIAVTAVHYNPQYWPNPEEFRPSRFAGEYNKDAFLAFGSGRRACIGRK
ncbi:cytochrome P450 family protein [Ceratobasidium sp. AG-Ba]|nr:cytochrome P450 family protein [Ceratobasidium sp. AG-Ba]QRW12636.1 cytochrome P450 family protein [Ceratobasidium sp. AG-Ba]